MGNFFHSPRKVTGQNLDEFKVPCKCDRSEYEYQPVTAEGELTLEGVYEQFLLDMQNDRHWARSTCIAYDREFWRSVAPIFRGIPYADLDEERAEKLWMERGQFGLGDRIVEQNAKKIFSCIVEQAYQHDLSQMRFWGNVDVELCKNGLARTAEGQKYLFNLAHKLLKRPKSLPISVVIRIYEEMLSRADRFGECVALLAMLLLGLRTSEAAGLSYSDIRQMDEDLYAIERRYVEKQSSRDVQVGGKTSNSYLRRAEHHEECRKLFGTYLENRFCKEIRISIIGIGVRLMRMKSCVGLRKLYWYIYCIRKSTICRKGFVPVKLGIKIRVYHQECIKKISQVDCMTYVQDYISCTLKIDLFSQFVDYHQICHIILEQARFCGKIL